MPFQDLDGSNRLFDCFVGVGLANFFPSLFLFQSPRMIYLLDLAFAFLIFLTPLLKIYFPHALDLNFVAIYHVYVQSLPLFLFPTLALVSNVFALLRVFHVLLLTMQHLYPPIVFVFLFQILIDVVVPRAHRVIPFAVFLHLHAFLLQHFSAFRFVN